MVLLEVDLAVLIRAVVDVLQFIGGRVVHCFEAAKLVFVLSDVSIDVLKLEQVRFKLLINLSVVPCSLLAKFIGLFLCVEANLTEALPDVEVVVVGA